VEVEGATVSILLPAAGEALSLGVPGGSPVPALTASFEGSDSNEVVLTFDREAYVAAIRAGVASGAINPRKPFAVSLYAGAHQIGSDLVALDRDPD
jgi:hypothetical protein